MKIERTKNAKRNVVWGVVNKIATLIIPFFCRTAIIQVFGVNYVGLNSLFASILSALNLAELGFGSAVVFFMYKAIATDDEDRIRALVNYFKRVYRIIGTVVLAVGLVLLPFLRFFVNKDVPSEINIYVIYLLTLAATVLTYFLFAYKSSLFNAFQRNDVLMKVSTVVAVGERILQLAFIFILKNYYLYIASAIFAGIANNLMISHCAKRSYPQYVARGSLDQKAKKDIAQKIKGLIFYKIGNVVSGSADTIVISSFLGLTVMGRYGNYAYVLTTLFAFLGIYYSAMRSGIGNSIATENKRKNLDDFKFLQFVQNWMISWATVCLLCLFQDFIEIYVGEEHQLPIGVVICFCIYFWTWKIQDIVHVYKEAAGLWDQDRFRPLIGSGFNLVLNIVFVQIIGLYGVILSTVAQFVIIDLPWASRVLFKNYFEVSSWCYYRLLIKGLLETFIMCAATYFVCLQINIGNTLVSLLVKALLCLIVPNIVFVAFNAHSKDFRKVVSRAKKIVSH